MKILFVSHQSTKQGASLFLFNAILYLKKRGFIVSVVFPDKGSLTNDLTECGINCYYVKNNWWIKDQTDLERKLKRLEIQVAELCAIIKNEQPDFIYSNTIVDIAGAIAAARLGLPHIWHFHELPYMPGAIEMRIKKTELARLIRNTTNLVIFNSQIVLNEWQSELVSMDYLIVKNWIDSNLEIDGTTQQLDTSMSMCYIQVGSIIKFKGQFDTVKAFHLLLKEGYEFNLYLIGPIIDTSYYIEIKEYLNQHDLNKFVFFTGYQNQPFTRYKNIISSINASSLESFGRITIESMYFSIPVIGAAANGNLELIKDNVTGLLYKPGDIKSLKEKMKTIAIDKDLRENLSREGKSFANSFTNVSIEMDPLIAKLKSLRGSKNPSWPLFKYNRPVSFSFKVKNYLLSVKLIQKIVYFLNRR